MKKIGKPIRKVEVEEQEPGPPVGIHLSYNFEPVRDENKFTAEGDQVMGTWFMRKYSDNAIPREALLFLTAFSEDLQDFELLTRFDLRSTFDQYPDFFQRGKTTVIFAVIEGGPNNMFSYLVNTNVGQNPIANYTDYGPGPMRYKAGPYSKPWVETSPEDIILVNRGNETVIERRDKIVDSSLNESLTAAEQRELEDLSISGFRSMVSFDVNRTVDNFFESLLTSDNPVDTYDIGLQTGQFTPSARDSNGNSVLQFLYMNGFGETMVDMLAVIENPEDVNITNEEGMNILGTIARYGYVFDLEQRRFFIDIFMEFGARVFPDENTNENLMMTLSPEMFIYVSGMDEFMENHALVTRTMVEVARLSNEGGLQRLTQMIQDDLHTGHMNDLYDGETPLIAAVRNNNAVSAGQLIRAGARVDVEDEEGITAVIYARRQNVQIAALIGNTDELVEYRIVDAIHNGDFDEAINIINTNNVDPNAIFFNEANRIQNIVNYLINREYGRLDMMDILIRFLDETTLTLDNTSYIYQRNIRTPVSTAIQRGYASALEYFIDRGGANPNQTNPYVTSDPPIVEAVAGRHFSCAAVLAHQTDIHRDSLNMAFLNVLRNTRTIDMYDEEAIDLASFLRYLIRNPQFDTTATIEVDNLRILPGDLVRASNNSYIRSVIRRELGEDLPQMYATPIDVSALESAVQRDDVETVRLYSRLTGIAEPGRRQLGLYFFAFMRQPQMFQESLLRIASQHDSQVFDLLRSAGFSDVEGALVTANNAGALTPVRSMMRNANLRRLIPAQDFANVLQSPNRNIRREVQEGVRRTSSLHNFLLDSLLASDNDSDDETDFTD